MARYHVTIHFDDRHEATNPDGIAAQLHASIIVMEADKVGFIVESAEFVDDKATTDLRGLTVDYCEFLLTDESQDEDSYSCR